MNIFICGMCGHLEFGSLPDQCPVCKSPKEKYTRNDRVFEESSEKSKEAAIKHIPSITLNNACGLIPEQSCMDVIVRIGATLHPMETAHFIQFIDCYVDEKYVSRIMLGPQVYAAGCFHLKTSEKKVTIVENCNVHGYWKSDKNIV